MNEQHRPEPVYMTAEQLAQLLGFSTQWVWRQTRTGFIPGVKLGHRWIYDRATIEQWIAQQTTPIAA